MRMGQEKLNGMSTDNLALRQLEDYDLGRPGTLFAGGIELSVDQAYALQSAVVNLRCKRGEKVIGYKVGCTSPAIRSQLGIDHCIMGRLFDTEQYASGTSVSGKAYAGLACEGELAIELSRPPTPRDFQTKGLPDCVSRVFPVIELHQYVIRSQKPDAAELIANNALHAGVVAGSGIKALDHGTPSLSLYKDGILLETCSSMTLTTTIASSLRWLVHHLNVIGIEMRAGQMILTGSVLGLFSIKETCFLRIKSEPFGEVEAFIEYEDVV